MLLYSTTGGGWVYPVRVTYSIVPDGTSVGGTPSDLQNKLSPYANWQQQIQKAAAVWEAVAGINLVQVSDNGAPISSGGNQQGDPNFGDIRIGGMSQPGSQLAFAYAPQPFNGGTIAGDIFFNTAQWWQTNATTYDLMTVAIHEFGHALGMGHSAINTATMYAGYNSAKQSSTSDDTTGVRSIYGNRQPDRFDASASNNSSTYATKIAVASQISLANLDISSGADVDWFKVTVPSSTTGSMTVRMQSRGLSSLVPRFTIYNESMQSSVTVTSKTLGDTISVTIGGVQSGETWSIKAMAGATGSSGIGAYGLQVNFGSSSQAAIAPPNTVVASQPDQAPTTSEMGTGWDIGGEFIPYLGILDLLDIGGILDLLDIGILNPLLGLINLEGLFLITHGTLSGYGNVEIVDSAAPPDAGAVHDHDEPRDTPTPGGMAVVPIGPLAVPTEGVAQGGPGSVFPRRSGRQGRARDARLQAVDAARARVRDRRAAVGDPAIRPPSPLRVGSSPRGPLTIPHHLTTNPS